MARRSITTGLSLLMIASCVSWATGQQPIMRAPLAQPAPNANDLSILMQAKLSSSQKVVEGLMSGDFNMIRKGATDLQKICDATGWRTRDDQVYGHYRSELKRGATKLIQQANAENLDGAAYGYMHTLTTCINCHDHCRNVLRVANDLTPKAVPIPVTEQENAAYQARTVWR